MRIQKAYIAGPMRGYPAFNFPAFDAASAAFRSMGWEVFSPAENDRVKHGNKVEAANGDLEAAINSGFNLREALCDDLSWICKHATAIVMLPGWEKSAGAQAEHRTAIALDLEIVYVSQATLDSMLEDFGPKKSEELKEWEREVTYV